jgi:hypothetical protein
MNHLGQDPIRRRKDSPEGPRSVRSPVSGSRILRATGSSPWLPPDTGLPCGSRLAVRGPHHNFLGAPCPEAPITTAPQPLPALERRWRLRSAERSGTRQAAAWTTSQRVRSGEGLPDSPIARRVHFVVDQHSTAAVWHRGRRPLVAVRQELAARRAARAACEPSSLPSLQTGIDGCQKVVPFTQPRGAWARFFSLSTIVEVIHQLRRPKPEPAGCGSADRRMGSSRGADPADRSDPSSAMRDVAFAPSGC